MIASSFSDVEEILKAVWIIRSVPEAAVSHLAKLAGSFLSAIAAERFRLEGIESALLSPEEAVRAEELPAGAVFVAGNLYEAPNTYDAAGRMR